MTDYSKIDTWTINRSQDDKTFIIGFDSDNQLITTDDIFRTIETNSQYMRVQLYNGTQYNLYFKDFMKPTYTEKTLYSWNFLFDNDPEKIDEKSGLRIDGFRDIDCNKFWVTTHITRYEYYHDCLKVFTKTGSSYLLYFGDHAHAHADAPFGDKTGSELNQHIYNNAILF
jgi:hypothetical protein